MKKFLLFAFAAVMLGFAGCNDDENKDNIPPTLRNMKLPYSCTARHGRK